MGPRTLLILQTYRVRLQMAAKAWGHYGTAFQIHRRATQGHPLSPTIFNVVVDYVIRHWVTVPPPPQEGSGQGLGMSIHTLSALFYTNVGLVASPESARL